MPEPWSRWTSRASQRSDVQMVDLYTRGSLHVIFWLLILMGTLNAIAVMSSRLDIVLVLVAASCLGLSGMQVVRAAFRLYPERGPLPRRPMLLLVSVVVAVGAWTLTLDPEESTGPGLLAAGTLAWGMGGLRDRRVIALVVVGGAVLLGVGTGSLGLAVYGAVMAAFFAFTVQSSLWLLDVVTQLDQARSSQAALAVAEERLRFSRDVHDVMGRHLATIAVQSELAATLTERGDDRAAELVREVRATAHEAMREARELARGYRPLDLDHELQGAVSLLRSAGIAAEADLDGLPPAWHPPVARLVREAVTNVLRHSAATWVRIGYDGSAVEVRNDRVRQPVELDSDGSGLRTLADEMSGLGANLSYGVQDEEFAVRLSLNKEKR